MQNSQQHMVAVTGPESGARGAGAVNKLLKPRYATRKDHEYWAEQLREYADQAGLDHMYSGMTCPTLAEIAVLYSEKEDAEKIKAAHADAVRDWQVANTQWFHVIRNAIDVSGPRGHTRRSTAVT